MRSAMNRVAGLVAAALPVLVGPAAAQAARPLDKPELIRLLTNPMFAQSEVADVVRRSCLTFRPTQRDWDDLRSAGADGEVIASAAACEARRGAPPPPNPPPAPQPAPEAAPPPPPPPPAAGQPLLPVSVTPITPEVVTTAGVPSSVRVSRGSTPQRQVTIVLQGSAALGLQRDLAAVTDDSGMAVFRFPSVPRIGAHQFEIRTRSGGPFPSRPHVSLLIRPTGPARLRASPEYVAFGRTGDSAATIVAMVTDSLGNPAVGEVVDVVPAVTGSRATDSTGRATFKILPASFAQGGTLQMRVRGLAPVELEVATRAGLSGPATTFVPGTLGNGKVGTPLNESLMFVARTVDHEGAAGHTVRFRG